MEEKQFVELTEKLDIIIKLLATQTLGEKTGAEAITLLSNFGLQPKEIAQLLGTTSNSVSVTLNRIKNKKVKKDAKKKSKK